jgi:hypothetical protein
MFLRLARSAAIPAASSKIPLGVPFSLPGTEHPQPSLPLSSALVEKDESLGS